MTVRAKFKCLSAKEIAGGVARGHTFVYSFAPQYDAAVPEDVRWQQYTPSGQLEIHVDNPAVRFEVDRYYYLDLSPVPAEEPAEASG